VRHRVEVGRWEHVARGVYRVAGAPRTWRQRLIAAVFAAGPGAVASHRSAAALWGLPGFPDGPVDVLRPRHTDHRSTLGPVHETRVLPASHIRTIDAIPTTSAGRTLFDLAGEIRPERLERALDTSLGRGIVNVTDLRALLDDLGGRGRRGVGVMRRLLDERTTAPAPESELERKLLAILAQSGLPAPGRQMQAGGSDAAGRVDFAYASAGLIIEADGRRHHMSKLDFENDRRRDNTLMAAGWRVLRITWKQVTEQPDEVVRLVRDALRAAA
jgi:very-short-patch-repair endonuclease